MFLDYEGACNRLNQLIAIIEKLSSSQRQLSLSALDFQALVFTGKRRKEKAVAAAEEMQDVLEDLIKLLKKVLAEFYNL